MAGGLVGNNAGGTQQQTINGKNYVQYTPAWYDAMRQDQVLGGKTAGQTAGAAVSGFNESAGLNGLYAANGVSGGSGGGIPVGGGGGGGAIPHATYDEGALKTAHANAFGAAKDEAAGTASASLNGLHQQLQQSGMGGGGYEAGQIGNTVAREANTIGKASRAEAQDSADLSTHLADENYQGDISQRGQDITSHGQELQAAHAQAQLQQNATLAASSRSLDMLKMALSGALSAGKMY